MEWTAKMTMVFEAKTLKESNKCYYLCHQNLMYLQISQPQEDINDNKLFCFSSIFCINLRLQNYDLPKINVYRSPFTCVRQNVFLEFHLIKRKWMLCRLQDDRILKRNLIILELFRRIQTTGWSCWRFFIQHVIRQVTIV